MRHYGWLEAAAKPKWERILALLDWQAPAKEPPPRVPPPGCPGCGKVMVWIGTLPRSPP